MAENESSHLMWIVIILAVVSMFLFGLKVAFPNLITGVTDKMTQGARGLNNSDLASDKIPDLENSKIRSGNVSAWNSTISSTLRDVKSMNLNTVTIPIRVNIDSLTSNNATIDKDSEAVAISSIKMLIQNKIKVIVEPYPFIDNGNGGETSLQPTDELLFMKNWSKSVLDIATDIKDLDVKGLYIGSNFYNLEDQSELFNNLISSVRSVFKGKLIYRTNWWYNASWSKESMDFFENKKQTPFFKNIDILAIAAYFEISDPDTLDLVDLKSKLSDTTVYNRHQNVLAQIEDLHNSTGKPIMFGELGIPNYVGAMSRPYAYGYASGSPKNNNIQAVWFKAWVESMSKYSWFDGYSIYSIGDETAEFYPNNLAQQTIKSLNDSESVK